MSFSLIATPAFSFVIPAKAGTHCLALTKKSSTGGLVYG
ncbi:MAG: hypothetical protein ACI8SR_000024 [Oceanicoccus sp.]|jgi:hypothetical protein